MKNLKKFLGVFFAVCMILATAVPAFAAANGDNEDSTLLSPYAGTVMNVRVIAHVNGELVEKEIEVSIPENATVEQERQLTNAAAKAEIYTGPSPRLTGDIELWSTSQAQIPTQLDVRAGYTCKSQYLNTDYQTIYVNFSNIRTITGSPSKINVRVDCDRDATGNAYRSESIDWKNDDAVVYMDDGRFYGDGYCYLTSGTTVSVWCSVDAGSIYSDISISVDA